MKFDLVITNPPFQDSLRRNKTPHKLWIDFTLHSFDNLLVENGNLVQVSPSSFASPSNKVLELMVQNTTNVLRTGTSHHFRDIGSTFSDYWITKKINEGEKTQIITEDSKFSFLLSREISYLPNDFSKYAISIHKKVMFSRLPKLRVEWDYVTAHNIRRYDALPSLSEIKTKTHIYPVFHTNRSTWWSVHRQGWADSMKVMWTRSGYTKPFFDPGELGGTDMVYFVRVKNVEHGLKLEKILNSKLFTYIFKSARWSGFGNERVFTLLPEVVIDAEVTDQAIFDFFGLTAKEVEYVHRSLGKN